MSDNIFIDTNLFVYIVDGRDEAKRKVSERLVEDAFSRSLLVVSYQVIQEFINASTKTKNANLSRNLISDFANNTLWPCCKVYPSQALFNSGFSTQERYGYSFYDSLIIAAAIESGCKILYSEDMHNGHLIEGLEIVNPFLTTS